MSDSITTNSSFEVHDPEILAQARAMLNACRTGKEMQDAVIAAVKRNEKWRGEQCINLLAPEAPTSPAVRALLSAEVGIRAAEGHIGKVNRWFAGTQYIDEIESLCVELLKKAFRARYADHRLVASMIGNLTVYTALTEPGDVIMSIAQPFGGHSSNRIDGPAGVRGLRIVDVPMDPYELVVDLELFRRMAPLVRPKLVALGASMTLFPFPLKEMHESPEALFGVGVNLVLAQHVADFVHDDVSFRLLRLRFFTSASRRQCIPVLVLPELLQIFLYKLRY